MTTFHLMTALTSSWAKMRRKLIFGVTKIDTTDPDDYQGVADGATLSVLRPGFVLQNVLNRR